MGFPNFRISRILNRFLARHSRQTSRKLRNQNVKSSIIFCKVTTWEIRRSSHAFFLGRTLFLVLRSGLSSLSCSRPRLDSGEARQWRVHASTWLAHGRPTAPRTPEPAKSHVTGKQWRERGNSSPPAEDRRRIFTRLNPCRRFSAGAALGPWTGRVQSLCLCNSLPSRLQFGVSRQT